MFSTRTPPFDEVSPTASPTARQMSILLSNLAQRPAKPALDVGRIQRAARRAMLVHGDVVTTAQVAQFGYARLSWWRPDHYRHCRRVLARIADRVGRAGGMGRPIVWRLRSVAEQQR